MKSNSARRFLIVLGACALAGVPVSSVFAATQGGNAKAASVQESAPAGSLRVGVAFDPVNQESNVYSRAASLEAPLSRTVGGAVRVVGSRSLREIAIGTRSAEFDALWVPSNLAVGAVKDARYEVIGFDGKMTKMALVVATEIATFDDLKGRTLYLPQEDSPASAVGVALLSDHGIRLSDFRLVFTSGSYQIAQFALEKKLCAATIMPEPEAIAWLAAHPGKGKVLEVSAPVPGQTLVARKTLAAPLKQSLSDYFATQVSLKTLPVAAPASYKYVTGLSHYTPEEVAGVRKVLAKEVSDMIKDGVQVVDVRTAAEFETKHIPGAKLLPYEEYSARIVGADLSKDGFDVSKLASNSKVVLYCNGPECWKSFKAALRANDSKRFEAVYWFRGGMPEWEKAGLPVTKERAAVASN